MVRIGSHSGTIVCKEGYIGVTSNIGLRAGILRCKDIEFVENKLIGYRSGVYTCNKLVILDKLVVIGPTSFYREEDTKVIEGPIELDMKSVLSDKQTGSDKKPNSTGKSTNIKPEYTFDDLNKLSFTELKKLGQKFRVRGRSREGLIRDILDVQAGKKEPEY